MEANPANGQPPPSTLAAQLVENISPSAKSARSDENAELKSLFGVIQRVKDQPQLLKTQKDRIEHNHMLIYVYCRVVLENAQLDDPFIDRAHLCTETLKAINFLRFTIKETPTVVSHKVQRHEFLFRGEEPLWVWLLPQLLRMLGHPLCVDLETSIEGLLQYLLLVIARTGSLLSSTSSFIHYIRAVFSGLLEKLQDPATPTSRGDLSLKLQLPPMFAMLAILGQDWAMANSRAVYMVDSPSHALRQAMCLANVLAYPLIANDPALSGVAAFSESTPWLLDSCLDLRCVQRRWEKTIDFSAGPLLELVMSILASLNGNSAILSELRRKTQALLVLLCSEQLSNPRHLIMTEPPGDEFRVVFCNTLVDVTQGCLQNRSISRMAASKLVNELSLLSAQHPIIGDDTDVWRCNNLIQRIVDLHPEQTVDEDAYLHGFKDESIRKRMLKSWQGLPSKVRQQPENKKRRLHQDHAEVAVDLNCRIYNALGLTPPDDTSELLPEQTFIDGFKTVHEKVQSDAIDLLSQHCCVADESEDSSDLREATTANGCKICENATTVNRESVASLTAQETKKQVRSTFSTILTLNLFQESRRLRITTLVAIRRLALHCDDIRFIDLETSQAGQWCLQCLSSSIRELRVAAGRTLSFFLTGNRAEASWLAVLSRNRTNAIAILRSISEKEHPQLAETCILAWGQIGCVVAEDELNLVLIKLIEYLGSSNSMVSSFAFNELLNLAEAHHTTPRRLLEPFWRSLAYLTTKDMIQRPQRSRVIAELLQLSVTDLLLLIQTQALPWLVLDKRKDVIQKMADARQETELWRPLMDSANLASILSLLLTQEAENLEEFVKSRLNEISPHFHDLSLLHLFQSEPVLIAMELLKAGGDGGETEQNLTRRALHLMATMIATANKESRLKKGNVIGRFLQSYVLGLMARLTDVINDTVSTHPPVAEQRRCIRALEEMIKVCKFYARIARPQISACLLSSMSQPALREASFSCWGAMLRYLEEEDVEALVETTFFIVKHYWALLDAATVSISKGMLTLLLDNNETVLVNTISKLPPLSDISDLKDVESRLRSIRPSLAIEDSLDMFSERLGHDYSGVIHQALSELVPYLRTNQAALYASTGSQRPDTAVTKLLRALLNCSCKYTNSEPDIARLCTESVGLIGCLDSNQVESVREQRSIVVLTNFEKSEETTDFALFLLQEVIVPAFLSATDTKLQGFLSFAMQELLDRCDIKAACAMEHTRMVGGSDIYRKWLALPESTRQVVTPFMNSRYMVAPMAPVTVEYPLFRPGKSYGNWLRSFVIDLLRKGQNPMADMIFEPLARVIRVKDLSTAEFLLPYLVLHILLGDRSTPEEQDNVIKELLGILQHQPGEGATYAEREDSKRYCHAVFRILDYALRWIHAKKSPGRLSSADKSKVQFIQACLDTIPAELIAQRAVECNEYARALFHLEQHAQMTEQQETAPGDRTRLLERLQDIYANIDEPDGLDGISAHLHDFDINQQILSHKKAGRWTAAQTWYEMQLAEKPNDSDVQIDLLNCLKQAGQHDVLLNHVEGMYTDVSNENRILPFAVEGAWVTGRWDTLEKFLHQFQGENGRDFNISVASALSNLRAGGSYDSFTAYLASARTKIASSMTSSTTASLRSAHDSMLQCHVLTDMELIVGAQSSSADDRRKILQLLDARLQVIGAYFNDKQYVLGIQRAAMELLRPAFNDFDISGLWLNSARLARKSNSLHQSFSAVLHASKLGDDAATIENAKLLWRDNHHRKAIQMLQGAIEKNKFMTQTGVSSSTGATKLTSHQKMLTARAQLLLAKWIDAAGQTHATALREKYQQPPKTLPSWEKGHYYLGRHYKKILEYEKPLKGDEQSDNYVIGEVARLVIENYVRSLNWGTKYLYQTLPRVLTLWLDMGQQVDKPVEGKSSVTKELYGKRLGQLNLLHSFLDKYIHRLPAYIFYTALPQIVARIAHPNQQVFERLTHIIVKVVEAHPRQALWSLIGIMTSKQLSERKARGSQIIMTLRSASKKVENTAYDLKSLLRMGEKLAEQLLLACQNGDFQGNKTVHASLTRDLRFSHKCTPCPLVVPVESSLTATLPANSEYVKKHKAFTRDVVSIDCFLDDVLVLSSLAKPRRLTARGSDGKSYMLLIKPKDDLRTDQRLMEFNGMINRSLKRDAESSRRQLYIRTYAVVPLNEECGIIEWVPGIKTMRDILLSIYSSQKIYPDYAALRQLMDEASHSESKIRIFTNDVLGRFPPILHLWFIQQFPSPSAWFAARLRYTRSCAVMSMVGTILGLGDRHGENVNLEEGNGGIFHVDFNCLFDKGATFAKPERVPFRLTHNMVSAMGIYGYEGPFRKSSELTLSILRQQEETLMTILEAFIYDPTLDLQKEKKSSRSSKNGPTLQPQRVVDSIKRKVQGLLPAESIPLGVEGQVDELIKQAVDPRNLTAMYIGWCPFL